MATQSLRVEEPRARVATFENDRKRTLSPPSSAYVIRVVANGETYGVPVTYNTRVASIIREVAELAISQEDSRVLGEVQATLYYRHQPLMPDAPIGSVPPESTLYFHVNQSYVEAAPVVPPAGRCATPSRLAAGKRGYLPQTSTTTAHGYPPNTSVTLRPVHNQGHQKMVDFSEPRSMSTSNSPPGVSEGSSEPQRSLPSGTNGDYAAMYQPAAGTNPVPVRGGYLPLSQVHPSPMYMAPPHHAVSEQSMHSSGKLGTRVPSTALPGNPWGLVDRGMTYRVPIKSSDDMPYGAPGAQATGYAQPYRGPYYAPPAASYPTTLHPVVPGEEQAYRQSHGSAKIHLSGMEDGRPVSRDTPDSAADAALPTSRPVAHVAEPVVAKEEPRVVVMESEVETHRRLSSPSPIPPQRSAAAPPVPPPPPAPPATIMVEPPENAELQSQVDLLQRSDQEHLLIYIELPEDKEMSNSVATTSHIGTANDQILALFPSMRRLRVRRNFPIATLRELYSVDRKWRIFMASTLIKDEHLTIGELNVAPNTIFRFGLPDASVMASKRRSSMISKQLMQSWTTNANSAMEEERSPVSRASTNSFIGNTAAPRLRSTSTQEAAPRTPPTDRQSHYSRDGQVLSEASRKKSVPSSSRLKHIQSKEETMEVRRRSSRMDDPMMQSWGERSTTAEPPARRESPPRNTRDGRTHAAEYQESHRQETFITPGQLKPRTTEQQRAEVVPVSATSQRLAPLAEERDSGRTRSSPPSTTLRRREAPDSDRTIDVNELSSSSSGPVGDAVSRATRSRQAYHQPRPSARRQATTVTTTTVRTSTRRQRHKHNLAPAVATVGPLDDNYVGSQITPSTLIPAGTAHDDGSARSTTMRYTYKRQEESLHNSPSSKPAVDDQQLLVTIVDPTDPTVFHHDVPVDRCFPVGILRELLAEELSSGGAGGQPALPLYDTRLYGIYCGSREIVDDAKVTFEEATRGTNNCVFSVKRR